MYEHPQLLSYEEAEEVHQDNPIQLQRPLRETIEGDHERTEHAQSSSYEEAEEVYQDNPIQPQRPLRETIEGD